MIVVKVTDNVAEVTRGLIGVQAETRLATAKALTFAAKDAQEKLRADMVRTFDRPIPFTINSLRIEPANVSKLSAAVFFKDISGREQHYLVPQVEGGPRRQKALERRLRSARPAGLTPGERLVPAVGGGAELDAYGNVKRSQIVRILSQLRALDVEGGFNASPTESRRSRRGRARLAYFWSPGRGEFNGREYHLPRGVWQRVATAFGFAVRPVFLAVRDVRYRARFAFYTEGTAFAQRRFEHHLEQQLARELAR